MRLGRLMKRLIRLGVEHARLAYPRPVPGGRPHAFHPGHAMVAVGETPATRAAALRVARVAAEFREVKRLLLAGPWTDAQLRRAAERFDAPPGMFP